MKKRFRIFTLVSLLAALALFPPLSLMAASSQKTDTAAAHAPSAEGTTQPSAPPAPALPKKSPSPKQIGLPLKIAEIFVKNSRVHITLVHTGGQKLTTGDFALTTVRLEMKDLKKSFAWPLLKVDPTRSLVRPAGRLIFDTGLELMQKQEATAVLTSGQWQIAATALLSPDTPSTFAGIRDLPVKKKTEKMAESPGLRLLDEKTPGNKIRMVAPGTMATFDAEKRAKASLKGDPIPFTTERDAIDRPHITVIRNDPIPVVPASATISFRYSFRNFDPAAHEPVEITIRLLSDPGRHIVMETAGSAHPDTDIDLAVGAEDGLFYIEVQAIYNLSDSGYRTFDGCSTTFTVGTPGGENGIAVVLSEAGHTVRPGSRIRASYSLTDPGSVVPDTVWVLLQRDGHEAHPLYEGPPSPGSILGYDLPSDVYGRGTGTGGYTPFRVVVQDNPGADPSLQGASDPFFIEIPSSSRGCEIHVDEAGDYVYPGSSITVRYDLWNDPPPGNIQLILRHHVNHRIAAIHTLYDGPPHGGGVATLPLPADIVGYEYRILLVSPGEAEVISAESASFSISPLGMWSTYMACEGCVFVSSPAGTETWERGETVVISWMYLAYTEDLPEFDVHLVNTAADGSETTAWVIPTDRLAWDSGILTCTLWGIVPLHLGTDIRYKVRVTVHSSGATDLSDGFVDVESSP